MATVHAPPRVSIPPFEKGRLGGICFCFSNAEEQKQIPRAMATPQTHLRRALAPFVKGGDD
jgi:hypothetical protein